ncbi:hypothetical protein NEOKW01_1920 [Nematocida sp. AWRm80]|nr:hypothetical protein NEOKW01_1920 [Nematocida sp. AWRm80]
MDSPDEIFREPWDEKLHSLRTDSAEVFTNAYENWEKSKPEVLQRLERMLEVFQEADKELKDIQREMEPANKEMVHVERNNAVTDREIENKQKALEVMTGLLSRLDFSKTDQNALEHPWLEKPEEIKGIETAIQKIKAIEEITNSYLTEVPAVKEYIKQAQSTKEVFLQQCKAHLIKKTIRTAKTSVQVYDQLGRYSFIIEYMVENQEIDEVLKEYSSVMGRIYKKAMNKEIESILGPFKRAVSKKKHALHTKVEKAFSTLFQYLYSLISTEAFFLSEVLIPNKKQWQIDTLYKVFREAEQELKNSLESIYSLGWEVSVLNLLSDKSTWATVCSPSALPEHIASISNAHRDSIVPQVKQILNELKAAYLTTLKKTISREYAKEGTIDLDKVYLDIVEHCVLSDINTEVVHLNLMHSNNTKNKKDAIYQAIRQACVVGAMQAFFLEHKEVFDMSLGSIFDNEIEKMTQNLMYLAKEKVFEKPKLESIIRRAKEIMKLINNIEGPFGFKLQVDFKDMVLSNSNFYERNEIAKVLVNTTTKAHQTPQE